MCDTMNKMWHFMKCKYNIEKPTHKVPLKKSNLRQLKCVKFVYLFILY